MFLTILIDTSIKSTAIKHNRSCKYSIHKYKHFTTSTRSPICYFDQQYL
uniref:Uncharacterized protein n=1 Tax=Arundo donax TaxID=35708 RepID=A0A0A8YT09_ARUDO